MSTIDQQRFARVQQEIIGAEQQRQGIGTLGERTLHAVLKAYYAPDPATREVKIGPYVADIAREGEVLEIQTRSFEKLRKKLELFLGLGPVTIIYPVARQKWIFWVDPATGETTKKRRSPKVGGPWEIFPELYKIRNFLDHPGLRLRVVLLDMEEYRYLTGWSQDKKRGATRADRIPVALAEEVEVCTPAHYARLIPQGLPDPFAARDYHKAAKFYLPHSRTALQLLHQVGAVERVGKTGNAFLYRQTHPEG